MENFSNTAGDSTADSSGNANQPGDTDAIKEAKANPPQPEAYTYTERDVMLYNLGIGAKGNELQWTYENSDNFSVSAHFF